MALYIAIGIAVGWWLRGTLDRYIVAAFVRILTSRAGTAKVAGWIGEMIAKHGTEANRG